MARDFIVIRKLVLGVDSCIFAVNYWRRRMNTFLVLAIVKKREEPVQWGMEMVMMRASPNLSCLDVMMSKELSSL